MLSKSWSLSRDAHISGVLLPDIDPDFPLLLFAGSRSSEGIGHGLFYFLFETLHYP